MTYEEALRSIPCGRYRHFRFYRSDRIERVEYYEADERGELPPDLKRGVLSQDALYELLSECE